MKIELDTNNAPHNHIQSYAANRIVVTDRHYNTSIIVSPEQLDDSWPPRHVRELRDTHLESVLEFNPEILLLGTGNTLVFPADDVLRPWIEANVGFEIMDTGAACRSYNILRAEGRQVVAALIMLE